MPAIPWRDRVQETTTTEGPGNILLAGAVAGFQSFSSAYGADTNNLEVTVEEPGGPWECLVVNYVHATQTLNVVSVDSSSNGGSKINWGPGTRFVYVGPHAVGVMTKRENLAGLSSPSEARTNLALGSIATINSPVPVANGGTGATTQGGAQTNLGLGTAATHNAGVAAAADLPQRSDADGRYLRGTSGTKMLFYQAAAPTGWTQDTTQNDKVIRVVSGSGGGSGGSWTISGLDVTGSTDNFTLTQTEMPTHLHQAIGTPRSVAAGTDFTVFGTTVGTPLVNTTSVGSGGAHAHGLNAAGVSSDGSWRPAYVDVIVATKN